ncbi:uncharacterized protein F4807DRAFT_460348 [Annulohypoxylon truncatum]|uniref:uncharacterized protein n=1 Tax=Annulohypoxylon truncatum TaxID=327061 RepID=UPI0020087A28|nr:uncharacterized protein F4807DRAFT_460348 [Annulohypoxylon truncatum]KAI1209601.1 hypothetical protein F4807DRAFT_460348 [Annulohypoxylon truncatum]
MSSPSNEAPTPTPAGTVAVPDAQYVPRPGDENGEIPAKELVDEKKAETVELPLTRDDKEAIDTSNIIGERTRHARPLSGTYEMPGDEEGLPAAEFVEVNGSGAVDGNRDEDVSVDGEVDMVETGEMNKEVDGEVGKDENSREVSGNLDEELDGEVDGETDVGLVTIK